MTRTDSIIKRINKERIPPSARKIICVDIDGTVYPFESEDGTMMGNKVAFPGAIDTLKALDESGWTIVIFTSRLSKTWWDAEGFSNAQRLEQRRYVKRLLDRDGIVYDRITSEKVPASYYLDDRAIEYTDWESARKRILGN